MGGRAGAGWKPNSNTCRLCAAQSHGVLGLCTSLAPHSPQPPGLSFPSNTHRNLGGSFYFCPWRRDYVPIQTHFPGKTSQNKEQNWKEGEQSQWEVVP